MIGRRIDGLDRLTPEQDLWVVGEYMRTSPYVQKLIPEHRADWYEMHLEHSKRFGTTVSEQLVITQEMADTLGRTNHAEEMLARLLDFADRL